jgi:hypothetical protein
LAATGKLSLESGHDLLDKSLASALEWGVPPS